MGYEIAGGLGVKMAALDDRDERPRRLRHGRRRLLPDDGAGDRHRGRRRASSSSSSWCRTTASPRSARCPSRSARSGSAPATATAPRRGLDGDRAAGRPGRQRRQPRRRRAARDQHRRASRRRCVKARQSTRTTVVHVETDPLVPAPDSPAWWDVPVAEVSALDSTQRGTHGVRASTRPTSAATWRRPTRHRREGRTSMTHHRALDRRQATAGERRAASATSTTRRAARSRPRCALGTAADVDAAVPRPATAFADLVADVADRARRR